MFKRLKFREKVKFWWKNKIWLKKVQRSLVEEQYGMIIYEEKDGSRIYGAYRSDGRSIIIPISKKEVFGDNWYENCHEIYDHEKREGYIFGTRKILYRPNDRNWKVIYNDDSKRVTGMLVNMEQQLVVIFKERGKDEIYKINKEQILQEPVLTGEIIFVNGEIPYKKEVEITNSSMEVLIRKNDEYYFYNFTKNEMYDPKIKFTSPEEYTNFLSHKPAKAYSGASPLDLLVTLVDGKVKEHKVCIELESLENKYYYCVPFDEKDAHLLKYINEEEIIDLGIIPKEANYYEVENILGIDFIVVEQENGITLLAVNENNELKTKFYEDAVEIKLAEPVLFENGNIMEIKPIAVYEELIEEN